MTTPTDYRYGLSDADRDLADDDMRANDADHYPDEDPDTDLKETA
jgi:hypothetical protein